MLNNNTDKITNAQLAKQTAQMGRMNLGNVDDEDSFKMGLSKEGLQKKAQAYQNGLIRMIG
jgi:hypothetical protein